MNKSILIMIIGMAVVTYIPRALPAILLGKIDFSGNAEKFLKLIPYTAMSALIFPDVFFTDSARPEIGLAGGAVAAILAWKKAPVMVCVLVAVAVDFALYSL